MPDRHPMLTYTALRVVVFAVPFALLLLIQVPLLWALVVAGFVSGIASIFLLSRQRDAVSTAIATRGDRANQRIADRAAAEDAWDDAQRSSTAESAPSAEGEPEPEQ